MNPLAKHYLANAVKATGKAAAQATEASGWLREANAAEPLPAGFLDHREDLKSAEATLSRVLAEMGAQAREMGVPS